jgi:hypothetical protein
MTTRGRSQSGTSGESDGRKARPTAAQHVARQNLGRCSRMWSELTEEQRTAWRRRVDEVGRLRRLGQYYRLNGQQLFNKLNSVLALCDQEPLTDPPPLPRFGPNPVGGLTITRVGHGLTLKLTVSGSLAEDIMLFASPPFNAGRGYCSDYRFIGLLSASVEHAGEITRLYVRKYGVPPPNTRIFIRAWQQVDGWECRGQMRLTNALVPPLAAVAEAQRGRPVGGKKG